MHNLIILMHLCFIFLSSATLEHDFIILFLYLRNHEGCSYKFKKLGMLTCIGCCFSDVAD